MDFQFDETADQRRLRMLDIVDENTRDALAMDVGRSVGADLVISSVERLAHDRGAPEYLRMDIHTQLCPDRAVAVQLAA